MKRLVILIAVAGCNPYLSVQSPAPPGRTARVDRVDGFWGLKYYRMELSRGVAIALTCEHGSPCEHMRVTSDDPGIAEVRPASLGVLEHAGLDNQQTSAALVVIGKSPGQTRVHVHEQRGDRDVVVTVIAAPTSTNGLTAAR